MPSICSEISAENFDKFDEEEEQKLQEGKKKKGGMGRKLDMNFIGYTYKADVENEKSLLLNILKDLDAVTNESSQTTI